MEGPWWQAVWQRLRRDASQRGAGFALALAIEVLIVLLLLSLSFVREDDEREFVPITSFDVGGETAPEQEQVADEPEPVAASAAAEPVSQPDMPVPVIQAAPPLPSALPVPRIDVLPAPAPAPAPTPAARPTGRIGAVVRSGSSVGPADTGNSRGEDSPVVGTAPDGSPLYAARWYREPTQSEMAGYLSTAMPGGWGLIACRTAPNWRVEDCEIVDEFPNGSGIARATQAAAWQFRVRPPRIGGEYQVGTWVRIRMSYTNSQRVQGY